ncbi:MAG TPA: substrate-binding domain-containing protein [Steroidobacter sp.]|uniref:substrate-binding domain-containing protein n=1 Tax=Steroidobacter sp. TaxID=1978227 RepID=UPI002ED94810
MNDDFLRSAWKRPPAAFEQQLRERLRQQELAPPPSRRPSWGLLIASVLIGGSALAAVTYLTVKHFSLPSSQTAQMQATHEGATPLAQVGRNHDGATYSNSRVRGTRLADGEHSSSTPSEDIGGAANVTRESDPSSVDSSPVGAATSGSMAPTASARASNTKSVRIALTPELAVLAAEIEARFSWRGISPRTEVATADAALQTLCTEQTTPLDIAIVSRRINRFELEECRKQGVREAKLGHMAMVITGAKAGTPMKLSADTLLRALLKKVPSPDGFVDNPYTDWNQIDRSLDPRRIEVLGPPRNSQHFLVFAATILEPACDRIRALQNGDRETYEEICHTLRDDGVYREVIWDDTFVGQRLWAEPNAVAVLDYSFYSANSADLLGSMLTGPAPTLGSIMDGSYPGARTLYLYVSKERYRNSPTVSSFLDDYLSRMNNAQRRWVISPESDNRRRRPFEPLPLTEVKVE